MHSHKSTGQSILGWVVVLVIGLIVLDQTLPTILSIALSACVGAGSLFAIAFCVAAVAHWLKIG